MHGLFDYERLTMNTKINKTLLALLLTSTWASANAADLSCAGLPKTAALKNALVTARGRDNADSVSKNGGFGLNMWATVVNRDGIVCAVAFTGGNRGDQWPGSRVISAQKANTANAFSLPALALSTANIYSAIQPGGSLYGLQHSNPVSAPDAYKGPSSNYGQANDPMVGKKIGGINGFGGGLALYSLVNNKRVLVGALGVSGDSSCADHSIAWRTRNNLALDYVPGGVSGDIENPNFRPDNIVYDIDPNTGLSSGGWGHPACNEAVRDIAANLPNAKKPR
jgi:uncharacterized protein GlcG (DUF336 family)